MVGRDEPGQAKMTSVTKLFACEIRIVKKAQKLAVIHRPSAYQNIVSWE
jgi:hypothetical protein